MKTFVFTIPGIEKGAGPAGKSLKELLFEFTQILTDNGYTVGNTSVLETTF